MPNDFELIAFADNIAVVCTSAIPFMVEEWLEDDFYRINTWMSGHRLYCVYEEKSVERNHSTVRWSRNQFCPQSKIRWSTTKQKN